MSIKDFLINNFKKEEFSLSDAYSAMPDKKKHSIRARLNENEGTIFQRVGRGIYKVVEDSIIVIEGDGRDLSFLSDNSIDCILTDFPWSDKKSNKGGGRNFCLYESFTYTQEDFNEKARVLKDGCFLVEIIPAENENNFKMLYSIKSMAEKAGLLYYSKVTWKKGSFVGNTGRKSKNSEDIMIFSKGKARALRPDAKKNKASGTLDNYMSGTTAMLPTMFDFEPVKVKNHQAEKPVPLLESILSYVTFPGEVVLDQFAGSGSLGEACIKTGRLAVLVEKVTEYVEKIIKRLSPIATLYSI